MTQLFISLNTSSHDKEINLLTGGNTSNNVTVDERMFGLININHNYHLDSGSLGGYGTSEIYEDNYSDLGGTTVRWPNGGAADTTFLYQASTNKNLNTALTDLGFAIDGAISFNNTMLTTGRIQAIADDLPADLVSKFMGQFSLGFDHTLALDEMMCSSSDVASSNGFWTFSEAYAFAAANDAPLELTLSLGLYLQKSGDTSAFATTALYNQLEGKNLDYSLTVNGTSYSIGSSRQQFGYEAYTDTSALLTRIYSTWLATGNDPTALVLNLGNEVTSAPYQAGVIQAYMLMAVSDFSAQAGISADFIEALTIAIQSHGITNTGENGATAWLNGMQYAIDYAVAHGIGSGDYTLAGLTSEIDQLVDHPLELTNEDAVSAASTGDESQSAVSYDTDYAVNIFGTMIAAIRTATGDTSFSPEINFSAWSAAYSADGAYNSGVVQGANLLLEAFTSMLQAGGDAASYFGLDFFGWETSMSNNNNTFPAYSMFRWLASGSDMDGTSGGVDVAGMHLVDGGTIDTEDSSYSLTAFNDGGVNGGTSVIFLSSISGADRIELELTAYAGFGSVYAEVLSTSGVNMVGIDHVRYNGNTLYVSGLTSTTILRIVVSNADLGNSASLLNEASISDIAGWLSGATNVADSLTGTAGADDLSGLNGNDTITAGTGDDRLNGGSGNDSLIAGEGADQVFAGFGADYIDAGAGYDTVYGDSGRDTIVGGTGNDALYGGNDADKINGNDGNDTIYGGRGNDTLYGDGNADLIYGDQGDDLIYGGTGNDVVYGGSGNDAISGQDGNDMLYGGAHNDTLSGGSGDDLVDGGAGSDSLQGDAGNDTLNGGGGDDTINGGDGNDSISDDWGNDAISDGWGNDLIFGDAGSDTIRAGYGYDTVYGGTEGDKIYGGFGEDNISGQAGDDTLYGEAGNDKLYGGMGNDWISGGADNDLIKGYDGNDTIMGDNGNDVLYGEVGDDKLYGGAGSDTIHGGDGADTILGNAGADRLYGNAGSDTFIFKNEEASGAKVTDVIYDFTVGTDHFAVWQMIAGTTDLTFSALSSYGNYGASTKITIDYDGDGVAENYVILAGVSGVDAYSDIY